VHLHPLLEMSSSSPSASAPAAAAASTTAATNAAKSKEQKEEVDLLDEVSTSSLDTASQQPEPIALLTFL
jgi:ribosomal protein L12E/L44/L45/RPP1/RPP2